MKIQIKHRYTGEVIFEHSAVNNTIKKTVKQAIFEGVHLAYADLKGADLSGIKVEGGYFYYADLRNADIQNSTWHNVSYINSRLVPICSYGAEIVSCFFDNTGLCFDTTVEEGRKTIIEGNVFVGIRGFKKKLKFMIKYILMRIAFAFKRIKLMVAQ